MRNRTSIAAALVVVATVMPACSRFNTPTKAQTYDAKSDSISTGGGPKASLFKVTQEQQAHLRITTVRKAQWSYTIHTTGTVDWDANHTTPVITQVNGPIAEILVETGTNVVAGQPLLTVMSPDMSNAVSAYKKAHNRLDLARRALSRSHDLLDHGAIAQKDLEGAEADYNDAATEVQNDLQALKIFGILQTQIDEAERQGLAINPRLSVKSPITGTVVQKLVAPGQLIQAGNTTCFLVSNISTVWVMGHIYDRDLAAVHVDDAVDVTNASFNEVFHGVISYVEALVDPATRTTSVRIVTNNPHALLKKDMFVDCLIHGRTFRSVLAVPASAVLHDADNQPFVYVLVAPGQFAQRLVTVGSQQDDQIELLSGCKQGEQVVAEGSLFLQFANSYQ